MECSQSIPDRYYLIKNRTVFFKKYVYNTEFTFIPI